MHPAYSVIVFTTLSGAGYGLLAWLAGAAITSPIARDATFGFVGMFVALMLVGAGLLSSTAHLGRPERAWRAFSQWRTSWLSREGILAVATFIPAGLLGIMWVFLGGGPAVLRAPAAILLVILALATVWSTGMIYQSLPTIRAWHRPIVTPVYLALSIASGGVLMQTLLALFGYGSWRVLWGTLLALALGAAMKLTYWRAIDNDEKPFSAGDATGLRALGEVRVLEQPHTTANYVMREMGYAVGRKHASRLRMIALAAGFMAPALALVLATISPGWLAIVLLVIGAVAMMVGMFVERWLFFAQAQHVVTLYYGAQRA